LTDSLAADEAGRIVEDTADLWVDAAQLGLGHPRLAASGSGCFQIALASLERTDAAPATVDAVAAYFDRWIARSRCPADDRHDVWSANGSLVPPRESPVPYAKDLTMETSWR
jgi:glutamate--cysteine ligase